MANLAIKGHATRGKEVIEIIEMLGGVNAIEHCGNNANVAYYISETYKNWINTNHPNNLDDYTIFTLEEFIKKFPYKIGDKVLIPEYESEVRIDDMIWDGFEIQYSVFTYETEWYSADELTNFNDAFITMKEKKMKYQELRLSLDDDDKLATEATISGNKLLPPNGYLIGKITQVDNGMLVEYVKKQPQYPKTYGDCYKIVYPTSKDVKLTSVNGHYWHSLQYLSHLLICRDAYWKIAGEQMGLGEPWKPNTCQVVYAIGRHSNEIVSCNDSYGGFFILEFPTKEMRDAFYENFKDSIESCKELL